MAVFDVSGWYIRHNIKGGWPGCTPPQPHTPYHVWDIFCLKTSTVSKQHPLVGRDECCCAWIVNILIVTFADTHIYMFTLLAIYIYNIIFIRYSSMSRARWYLKIMLFKLWRSRHVLCIGYNTMHIDSSWHGWVHLILIHQDSASIASI